MQEVDPTGSWVEEAAQHHSGEDDNEECAQAVSLNVQAGEISRVQVKESIRRRETDLLVREKVLMQREIELLRCENEVLRSSPQSNTSSIISCATINIKNVGELLNEYNGSGEDFE